jgi:hypothetical protein
VTPEDVADHEAGHACAAVCLGVPVRLIDAVGNGVSRGWVSHGLGEVASAEDAVKRMVIILCGLIESDWLPEWPLDPSQSRDEYNLHVLAEWLGLDERGYRDVQLQALKLSYSPAYLRLHSAVTGTLDFTPRIDAALLEQLQTIVQRRRR